MRKSQASRATRDGKLTVNCPQCGTQYRVPEEAMDLQVQCRQCHRHFHPSKAGRRGARNRTDARPFVWGGAALVFMVIAGLLITNQSQTTTRAADTTAREPEPDVGINNPRVIGVQAWITALNARDAYNLGAYSDLDAIAAQLGETTAPSTDPTAEQALLERLFTAPETEPFREFEVTSAVITDRKLADAPTGQVEVYLAIKPEHKAKYFDTSAAMLVSYRFDGLRSRVTGWSVSRAARLRAKKGPVHKPHEAIGASQTKSIKFGGQDLVVEEAELVPLGHYPGTPVETQREIDELVAKILDLDAPGGQMNRAIMRLKEIGKPSVPRLLNKMYETKMDSQDNVLRLKRLARALSDLSGNRFGFNPAISRDESIAADEESRLSSLRQWYGWWTNNHDRDDWNKGIQQGDDLESEPDPNKR